MRRSALIPLVLIPLQARAALPTEYESLDACAKQNLLWTRHILPSEYPGALPPFQKLDILGLATTDLLKKMTWRHDEAPEGWKKALHRRASVATVRFVADAESPYTGLFRGAECGLLRLSLTGAPEDRGFAPGLALKLFVTGQPSANFSALVSLTGQGTNYNFFANSFSTTVPPSDQLGARIVHLLFSRVSRYPERLAMRAVAEYEQDGTPVAQPHAPVTLILQPTASVQFVETPARDVRYDFATLTPGTTVFEVLAKDTDESAPLRIGTVQTTSRFVASEYGDDRLFFQHQRFERD